MPAPNPILVEGGEEGRRKGVREETTKDQSKNGRDGGVRSGVPWGTDDYPLSMVPVNEGKKGVITRVTKDQRAPT